MSRIFLLVLILFSWNALAVPIQRMSTESDLKRFSSYQKRELLDIKPSQEIPAQKNQYFFFLGLDNDNYYKLDKTPAFKRTGNDFGQTHALVMGGVLKEPKKGREYGLTFETALYTRYLNHYYTEDGTPIIDQNFREITTLDATFQDPRGHTSYFRYLLGVGLVNDSHALPPFALWQQSGNNGSGGVHDIVGLQTKLRDIPSGGKTFFLQSGWSVGDIISLEKHLSLPKHLAWMNFTFESGFLVRTIVEGNTAYGLAKWNIPIIRSDRVVSGKGLLDFNFQAKTNYYTYENCVGIATTYGLQVNFQRFGFLLNFTKHYGNQNPAFFKYTDEDPLLSGLIFASF